MIMIILTMTYNDQSFLKVNVETRDNVDNKIKGDQVKSGEKDTYLNDTVLSEFLGVHV